MVQHHLGVIEKNSCSRHVEHSYFLFAWFLSSLLLCHYRNAYMESLLQEAARAPPPLPPHTIPCFLCQSLAAMQQLKESKAVMKAFLFLVTLFVFATWVVSRACVSKKCRDGLLWLIDFFQWQSWQIIQLQAWNLEQLQLELFTCCSFYCNMEDHDAEKKYVSNTIKNFWRY